MRTELTVLAAGCIWGLVHIFAAVGVKTRQYGAAWNVGSRDQTPEPRSILAGRLTRAQANYFETFPLAAAAILIVAVTEQWSLWSAAGALIWISARVIYLPLYASGVPKLRTVVFLVSVFGILALLVAPLLPA